MNMKKLFFIIISLLSLTVTIDKTLAYFNTNNTIQNKFETMGYNIILNSEDCTYGSSALSITGKSTVLPTPQRTGYSFSGYSKSSTGSISYYNSVSDVSDINNIILYPKWSITRYNISYTLNNGSASNPTSYTIESDTFTLNNPTRTGYIFTGWTGSNGSVPQTTVTIAKGSTGTRSYTANWSARSYSLSINLNGGSASNQSSYTIETNTFTLNNPTKEGYTFTGWTGSNGSTPQTTVTITKGSTGNKTYTANWAEANYTISYELNEGIISGQPTTYTISSEDITLPTPSKEHYVFTGWTGSNGSTPQTTVTITKGSTGNKTYTVNWTPVDYSITYTLNGGTNTNPTSYNIDTETFTLSYPTRNGYTFTGWTGSNGTTATKDVTITKGTTGDLSYTANWKLATYRITYNYNGGTPSIPGPSSYTMLSSTITLYPPTKSGYTFIGWTGSNGSVPQTTVRITTGSYGNKIYIANWTLRNYTISYELNGGIISGQPTNYTKTSETFTLPIPTKEGNTFAGWTGSNGDTPQTTVTITKGSTGNKSYTANWTPITKVVTYYNTSGGVHATRDVSYGSEIPYVDYSVDQIHVFEGWFTANGTAIGSAGGVTDNVSVYARVREANCVVYTGQVTDGDTSRLYRFGEILSQAGLSGYISNNMYVTNPAPYSQAMNGANHLLNNTNSWSWPYLRWLGFQCGETGYDTALRY